MEPITERLWSVTRTQRLAHDLASKARDAYWFVRETTCRHSLDWLDAASGPSTSIRTFGAAQLELSALVRVALQRALDGEGGPSTWVREIEGMSGQRYRTFIHELIGLMTQPRYLEVGSWRGSTCLSAVEGNHVHATCIDNWSLFGGPKADFLTNIARAASPELEISLLEQDFRSVAFDQLGKFDVYMFDGPHDEQAQYDGIVMAQPALQTPHLLIVDDWNWRQVRLGTLRALIDLQLDIDFVLEVRTSDNNELPDVHGRESDWHNGYCVCVVRGRKSLESSAPAVIAS